MASASRRRWWRENDIRLLFELSPGGKCAIFKRPAPCGPLEAIQQRASCSLASQIGAIARSKPQFELICARHARAANTLPYASASNRGAQKLNGLNESTVYKTL